MAVDVTVYCSCWSLGGCKPCPIDVSRLIDDDWCGHPQAGPDLTAEERALFNQWSEAACAHRHGIAMTERLCSARMVPVLIERIQSKWAETCPLLLAHLDAIAGTGVSGTDPDETPALLREIDALYATGFADELTETGPDTLAGMIDVLHRATKMAAKLETNIVCS